VHNFLLAPPEQQPLSSTILFMRNIFETIKQGGDITFVEALELLSCEGQVEIAVLLNCARQVFLLFQKNTIDLCSLVNAKSGRCSENCAFCAQSCHWPTDVATYPLLDANALLEHALKAQEAGAQRFCIVTSGRSICSNDFEIVLEAFGKIKKNTDLNLDGSLGLLSDDQMKQLKEVGVSRINHNLETSREFFPNICTTHSFDDRYSMVKKLKASGFEVCSGGIIGLGENREDRVSLAFSLKELHVDCVPINILNPRPGTPLMSHQPLDHMEIIKTIAVFRLVIPRAVIKIAGGREINLANDQLLALKAGANGIIIGGYLTTQGNSVEEDWALIREAGFEL
jgi:biotin synthase